jgi:DNA polymerase-3 subunit alpha
MTQPFAHLHCHSHYSLLDGAASIDRLIERTIDHDMTALAITDHGNLHGALEFYQKAKRAGINPVLGYEAYIAPQDRRMKQADDNKEASYHLTLLAQNRTGFNNLVKLASIAYIEGFYRKPRIDKEVLQQYNEGLICLSGCVSGELSRLLLQQRGDDDPSPEALELARWFHSLFGDRYFIEIQNNGLEIQKLALRRSAAVAERLGLPMVATSDTHYVDQADAEAQDVMLCINTGKYRTDARRMKMEGDQFYLRPPDLMYQAFPGHEDAVARSQEIADSVAIELELGQRHFPRYSLPPEESADGYLRKVCLAGLQQRYADDPEMCTSGELSKIVLDRLNRELDVISKLGFANYFLIVWDFVRKSRELNIPATARGSGVGALVSYALYLSPVCPIKYDLLFERFLDPSREEAPDIDIDFCKDRRGEIIRYVKEKYGDENVAQIGTFGTLAARAAIRDVGRTLGIPIARVNQVIQMVPDQLGITLSRSLEKSKDLKSTYEEDAEIREVLDLAMKIEGLARNVGTHAAAVVIADRPLTDYVPLTRVVGKTDVITQWAMADVEAAGLLKMDFLGLRNLTTLARAVDLIEAETGQRLDVYKLPLDDQDTFALLARGETKGVFQLESGGIRDLLQKMKPDCFHDIIATNALYRPGPLEGGMVDDYVAVKHGRKQAEYNHPVLKDVLEETHGVMVYQEQVMRILNRLGGIELADAYKCIKAISKKKKETIDSYFEQFLAGAKQQGLAIGQAKDLWALIEKFAGYGFNKSHSTAYALIAYITAYLKVHYPCQFMAALLSSDIPGRNFKQKDSTVEHIEDCQRMEIEVVPPDVNTSDADYRVEDGKIYFALSAIKGCGGGAAEAVVGARRADGPFEDLFDFCERVEPSQCNRATIETLIKAGAMDSLRASRAQLMAVLDRALQSGAAAAADRRAGQQSLFGGLEDEDEAEQAVPLPDIPDWEKRDRLAYEKEVLGFYLSSHPLEEVADQLQAFCTHTTSELSKLRDRSTVYVGGMISSIKISRVRKVRDDNAPTKYAMFDLEDMQGNVRCILWPNDYVDFGQQVQPEAIVLAKASVDRRGGGDEVNLIVNELIPLDQLDSRYTRGVMVRLDEQKHGSEGLRKLHEISRAYPGKCDLQLQLALADGRHVLMTSGKLRVDIVPEYRRRVEELVSPDNFRLLVSSPKAK